MGESRGRWPPDWERLDTLFRELGASASESERREEEEEKKRRAVLVVRCCMSALPLLGLNSDLGRALVALLRSLLSQRAAPPEDGPSFLPAILEVFIENFFAHPQLRHCFAIIDSASPVVEKLFAPSWNCVDLHVIPELLCWHFLLALRNERQFENFVNSLSCSKKAMSETPEIGLPAALALVGTDFFFSLPNVVQAHVVLLASGCINAHTSHYNGRLDNANSGRHMVAFEISVHLYLRYLPTLGTFGKFRGNRDRPSCFAKSSLSNSWIQGATSHKLSCRINKLLSFCQSHSTEVLSRNEADILNSSVSFIEENKHVVHEQFRQECNDIMKSLISNILAWTKQEAVHEANAPVSEEIVCLAAVLKLMGSSLLQILCHMRHIGLEDCSKRVNHAAFLDEHNFILETMSSMGQYEANQLYQHNLFDLIGQRIGRESVSMKMLAHFASLAMYSLSMRLGLLWKCCIFMMMTILNLVCFEEEKNLGSLKFGRSASKESTHSPCDEENNFKGLFHRKSSTLIASQFKKLQQVHLRDEVDSRLSTLRSGKFGVRRCDSRAFFECLPGYQENPSDWDDLLDFVECKEGRDYSSWLRQNKKFRDWKNRKRSKLSLKAKKVSLSKGP